MKTAYYLVVPETSDIETDQEFSAFHLCSGSIRILERAVAVEHIVDRRIQEIIVAEEDLESVAAGVELQS